ncbi:MAG: hypothetical protein WCT04_25480 [Planctomycetota bacterium]
MRLSTVLILTLVLGAASTRAVEFIPLPAPELTHLAPLGGQIGTTVDVTITGQHLDGASALVFADPAITSEPKLDAAKQPVPNVLVVHLPATLKSGMVDARARGKFGLSNPRRFCIGSLPEIAVPTPAASQDKAIEIKVNSVVNATTTAGARSWFKFHAQPKQSLFIRIESPDTRFEPQLNVTEISRRESLRGTSELTFTPQTESDYLIELHDLLYRGGADCRYRLIVSTERATSQRPDAMASSFIEDAEIQRINTLAFSSPNDAPNTLALTPPCEHIGLFPSGGQPVTFNFSAKKGSVFWIDILSHRLGHITDPEVVLSKVDGPSGKDEKLTVIAEVPDVEPSASGAGFALNMRDGSIRFEAKEDGAYRLSLRDIFNTAPSSPRLPYRLNIRSATPDFQLVAVPDQGPRARPPINTHITPTTVRRGGVTSFRVFVQRQDGFVGDIALKAENLPAGVTCLGAILGSGDECASLAFYVADNAAQGFSLIRVSGTAKINGQDVTRTAHTGTPIWTVTDTRQDAFRARLTDSISLAVLAEEAPMLLELETPGMIDAAFNAKVSLKLKVTRRSGYEELVKVRAFVLGDQDKAAAKEYDIPPKVTSATIELDLAALGAKPGEHTFVLHGNAERVKYKKNADEVPAAEAETKRLAAEAATAAAALKKSQDAMAPMKQKATDAEAKLKAATPADKATLEAAMKAAKDELAAAEKVVKEADIKSKEVTQAKTKAEQRSTELAKTAQPKDMTFVLVSKPIHIRIAEAPAKK